MNQSYNIQIFILNVAQMSMLNIKVFLFDRCKCSITHGRLWFDTLISLHIHEPCAFDFRNYFNKYAVQNGRPGTPGNQQGAVMGIVGPPTPVGRYHLHHSRSACHYSWKCGYCLCSSHLTSLYVCRWLWKELFGQTLWIVKWLCTIMWCNVWECVCMCMFYMAICMSE